MIVTLLITWLVTGLIGWWLIEKALLAERGEITVLDRSFAASMVLGGPVGLLVGVLMMVAAKWPDDRVLRTNNDEED